MADRRPFDPDTLLREHFAREVAEERRRALENDPSGILRSPGPPDGKALVPPGIVVPRRRARLQELAAAALLAACAAAAVAPRRAGDPIGPGTALTERTLNLGREVGGRMARAALEFADSRRPSAPPGPWIPGRFRGKE